MYPNIKIKFGIAEERQYFRVIIPNRVLKNENPLDDPKYVRGGNFVDDLNTRDWAKIGRWVNLGDISQYMNEFREEIERCS